MTTRDLMPYGPRRPTIGRGELKGPLGPTPTTGNKPFIGGTRDNGIGNPRPINTTTRL